MNFLKKFSQYIFFVFILLFLYFNLLFWQVNWLGWLLLILYFLIVGGWWQNIYKNFFALNTKSWNTKVLAWLITFFLLTLIGSVILVFYTLNLQIIFYCYLFTALFTLIINYLSHGKKHRIKKFISETEVSGTGEIDEIILFKNKFNIYDVLYSVYLVVWLLAFYLLYQSQSSAILNSPWQTINKYYPILFFVLTFLSGLFLFLKFKTKTFLFILVLQTLLLHLYLPLSHEQPWGGDVWRHLAVESKIQNGELVLPVLIGEQAKWREVVNINLPEALLIPNKYTYGHLWSASLILSNTLQIELININKWLVPILWSLTMPFVLYRLGWILFDRRHKGLWLAWLGLLPFTLQALGGLTLPVSFDLILFLLVLALWLQYLRDGIKAQRNLILVLAILMLFSYSLYFILIWVVIFLSSICRLVFSKFQLPNNKNSLIKKGLLTVVFFFSLFVIPAIELIFQISYVPVGFNFLNGFKQLIGQFSGWFYASLIRPHDILSGNIIFNHTPDLAFVANVFNFWRWWLPATMMSLWIFVGFGIYKILKTEDIRLKVIGLLFSTVFGGYLIGWFVLNGDRLFTRRLDPVLAVLILILAIQGFSYLLAKIKFQFLNFKFKKFVIILLILALSWFVTFNYVTGPDMRVVSQDEYKSAEYINNNFQSVDPKFCILADTWVLLPLEGLSAGRIVGGGFPIDYQFSQPEMKVLFAEMSWEPRPAVLELSHKITETNKCWFVQSAKLLGEDKVKVVSQVMNSQPEKFSDLLVWKEATTTASTTPLKKAKK